MSRLTAGIRPLAGRPGRAHAGFHTVAGILVATAFSVGSLLWASAVARTEVERRAQAGLADVRRDPRAAVLVDHYAEDWTQLWWVRIDGTAVVHEAGELADRARTALASKYPPYAAAAPTGGAVLVLTPNRWAGWQGSAPPPR